MTKKLPYLLTAVCLVGVLTGTGCSTNTQGDEAVPVYLTVDAKTAAPIQNLATQSFDTLRQPEVVLTSKLKNPAGGSSSFLDVKIDDYLVEWERVDGGTRVPASEVWPAAILVPAAGTTNLTNYQFMSINAWRLPPLDQLYPFNGGLDRETGRSEIRCRMKATFRGRTLAGEPVSATGDWSITFVYQAGSIASIVTPAEGN